MSMDLFVYLKNINGFDPGDLEHFIQMNFGFAMTFPEGLDLRDQSGVLPIRISDPNQPETAMEYRFELESWEHGEEELAEAYPGRPWLLSLSFHAGPHPYLEELVGFAFSAYFVEKYDGLLLDPQEGTEYGAGNLAELKALVRRFKKEAQYAPADRKKVSPTSLQGPTKQNTRWSLYLLVLLLLFILFSARGYIANRAGNSPEEIPPATSSVPAIDAEADRQPTQNISDPLATQSNLPGETALDDQELAADAFRFLKTQDYLLLIGSRKKNDESICRLLALDGSYDKTMQIKWEDYTFKLHIYEDRGYSFEMQLDEETHTAKLTVSKLSYLVDFDNGSYTTEISYREKDLDEQMLVDRSPDGRLLLYLTYLDGEGESRWGDYVIHNQDTDSIYYLAPYTGFENSAVFVGSDSVLIARPFQLEYLDAATGHPLPHPPAFDYQPVNMEEYLFTTVGVGYDREANVILLAFRESREIPMKQWPEATHPVFVSVFTTDGRLLQTIETGYLMTPYYIYGHTIAFEFLSGGKVRIFSAYDNVLGDIEYQIPG